MVLFQELFRLVLVFITTFPMRGAYSVMVIIVGNEFGDWSSNFELGCLHFIKASLLLWIQPFLF